MNSSNPMNKNNESEILFEKLGFSINSKKQIFYRNRLKKDLIALGRIKRQIFEILEDEVFYYLLDRVGDCVKIKKEDLNVEEYNNNNKNNIGKKTFCSDELENEENEENLNFTFLFGIIGLPKSFNLIISIKDDKPSLLTILIVQDSFNRIFLFNSCSGKIINILLFKKINEVKVISNSTNNDKINNILIVNETIEEQSIDKMFDILNNKFI